MFLAGIQKLTLLDYPGRVACTVFTNGCDLTMPVLPQRFAGHAGPGSGYAGHGRADGLPEKACGHLGRRRGDGGRTPPHPEIGELLERIKDFGYSVKLDTNGTFPDRLHEIVEAGLADRVAMDIKSAPENYARVVGLPSFNLAPVRESVSYLMGCGVDYEFRTTAVKPAAQQRGLRRNCAVDSRGARVLHTGL